MAETALFTRERLGALAGPLFAQLRGTEIAFLEVHGERGDFVRFNGACIRQAGRVDHARVRIELVDGKRAASAGFDASGDVNADAAACLETLRQLRDLLPATRQNPYIVFADTPFDIDMPAPDNDVGDATDIAALLCREAPRQPGDFVAILACGVLYGAFASSLGARGVHVAHSTNLDFSLHADPTTAVKHRLGGAALGEAALTQALNEAGASLRAMTGSRAATVTPGRHRAYLGPRALAEVFDALSWSAFDLEAQKSRTSPLVALLDGEDTLNARVTLTEDHARGVDVPWTAHGYAKPESVTLVDKGLARDALAHEAVAAEYGTAVNARSGAPSSLAMAPGDVTLDDVAATVGDGLIIEDLWYLNVSDQRACRLTGSTRFACLRVEGGRVVGALAPMRIDASLYDLLGPELEGLSATAAELHDPGSYGARSRRIARLPGALTNAFELVS